MKVWILENNSGITLYYKSFMGLQVHEHLVSGFLSALNQFLISEFKQPIESIDMGGLRWIYILDEESDLLFVASDTKDVKAEILRARLTVIKQSFTDEYLRDSSWRENWHGDLTVFQPFTETIEKYYEQWTQVEDVMTAGEFFDILGIFQHILNMVRVVIEEHTVGVERDLIYKKIDNIFETFINQQTDINNQELCKITYSKDSGFNILNINPNNCEIVVVKEEIFNLIGKIVQSIKDKVGHELCLVYFDRVDTFNYLFNNIVFLKELKLDIFLLQLFLS